MALASKLTEVFRDPSFVDLLVGTLDSAICHRGLAPTDELRDEHLAGMVTRVIGDLASHPRRELLAQFLECQSKLSDSEVIHLFEFVYSFLVNQFKGELAESFAWPNLIEFLSALVGLKRVPDDTEIVSGIHVRAPRRQGARGRGWYKNADALLVAHRDSVLRLADGIPALAAREALPIIVGAAEIKSYRVNVAHALTQLDKNTGRLSIGARVRGVEIASGEALMLVTKRTGRCACLPVRLGRKCFGFARIVIRPQRESSEPGGLRRLRRRGNDWTAELPITTEELSWAAYQMTDWLIGEMGSILFASVPSSDAARMSSIGRNPWPEMTGSEAGRNAFRAAMYDAGLRPVLRDGDPSRRAVQTFRWLYNAVCYGHERATGVRVLFPEHLRRRAARHGSDAEPARRRSTDDVLRVIHRAYAREHLQIARRLLDSESRRDPSLAQRRKYSWLKAMIAYRQCRFADALHDFPGAEGANRDYWWTRDQVMLARLRARNGDGPGARSCLVALEPLDQWPYGALPIEFAAVSALAHIADRRADEAARYVGAGLELLAQLRARQEVGDLGNVHPGTVVMAILDLACCLVALGRQKEAVAEITRLSGVDKWIVEYVRNDPMLAVEH